MVNYAFYCALIEFQVREALTSSGNEVLRGFSRRTRRAFTVYHFSVVSIGKGSSYRVCAMYMLRRSYASYEA